MRNLLFLPEYKHLRPLAQLRDHIDALTLDVDARGPRINHIDPAAGYFRIEPQGALAPIKREQLLAMILSIQADENRRVHTEYGEDAEPAFELITPAEIIAIDYLWSLDGGHKVHQALRIYEAVSRGGRMLPPEEPATPRLATPEPSRYYAIPEDIARTARQFFDPMAVTGAQTASDWWDGETSAWDVDDDAAADVLTMMGPDWIRERSHDTPIAAAKAYLAMGVVDHPHGQRRHLTARAVASQLRDLWERGEAQIAVHPDHDHGQQALSL